VAATSCWNFRLERVLPGSVAKRVLQIRDPVWKDQRWKKVLFEPDDDFRLRLNCSH
jgi:hypothetical protein